MATITPVAEVSDQRKRWPAESCSAAGSREERQTMNAVDSRVRRRKPLAAGMFQPEISSFRLALAAEGKAAKTVRNYTEEVQWFAAAHLIPHTFCTRWEQVSGQDVQGWMVWLLARYSDSYVSNQCRALQQFFKWWAAEEELPDPMAGLRPPKVTGKLVRCSPALNYRNSSAPAKAGRSPSAATRRSSRCSARPGSGYRSSPGSATTLKMRSVAISIYGSGRSPSVARTARHGSSISTTRPPASSTGISVPGPGMRRPGGRSCGWASITGGR